MTWRHPDVLWCLLLCPLLVGLAIFVWRSRIKTTREFGREDTVESLTWPRTSALRWIRTSLFVLGLGLAILALAGPQYGSRTRILRKRGVDIVIALDFSKSMLAKDVRPNRIDRAKAELSRFLDELGGDRVGIVAFAGETMEFPLTDDYAALTLFFRDLGPYDMPVGGTAIGRALIASKRLLERSQGGISVDKASQQRSRVVILMTDGEDHEGNPAEAAQELAKAGVKTYVVGIGSRTGEPIPTYSSDGTWTGYMRDDAGNPITTMLSPDNEKALQEIAKVTKGKYFRARQGSVGVDEIRKELRHLKQAERKSRRLTVHEDRFVFALFPAFLLLLLESLLPEAWRGRKRPLQYEEQP